MSHATKKLMKSKSKKCTYVILKCAILKNYFVLRLLFRFLEETRVIQNMFIMYTWNVYVEHSRARLTK